MTKRCYEWVKEPCTYYRCEPVVSYETVCCSKGHCRHKRYYTCKVPVCTYNKVAVEGERLVCKPIDKEVEIECWERVPVTKVIDVKVCVWKDVEVDSYKYVPVDTEIDVEVTKWQPVEVTVPCRVRHCHFRRCCRPCVPVCAPACTTVAAPCGC
ncbi:MAG: hypothetical protein Q4C96_07440 [Planctomycetia bacterium]|nr:hypothetical protein [Planctomycetia bacterium]